jgi:ComF family protein
LLQAILDMIYPVCCPVCSEIVIPKGERICPSCREKLQYIKEPRCKKCSKPIEIEEKELCGDCEHKKFHFEKGYAVWVYDETMKRSIANFKYHNKKEYAKFYIDEIVRLYGSVIKKLSVDAIVPVPLHPSKYRERGYNQADILAKGIGKKLELPVISKLLLRTKKTLPQKKLSDKERFRNLQEAFQYNEKVTDAYQGKLTKVLLVDDIYTTGSTIEACSKQLLTNGVKEVYFIILCIGKGF